MESKLKEEFELGGRKRKRHQGGIPGASQPDTEEAGKQDIQNGRKVKSLEAKHR